MAPSAQPCYSPQGFEWVNDADAQRAKWGYNADTPGAVLTLALDVAAVLHPSIVSGGGGRRKGETGRRGGGACREGAHKCPVGGFAPWQMRRPHLISGQEGLRPLASHACRELTPALAVCCLARATCV